MRRAGGRRQTTPRASIAFATRMKPAVFAPVWNPASGRISPDCSRRTMNVPVPDIVTESGRAVAAPRPPALALEA